MNELRELVSREYTRYLMASDKITVIFKDEESGTARPLVNRTDKHLLFWK